MHAPMQQEQSANGDGLRRRGGGGAADGDADEGDTGGEADGEDDKPKDTKRRWPPILTHPLSPIDPSWRISTCGAITLAFFAIFVAFFGPGIMMAYVFELENAEEGGGEYDDSNFADNFPGSTPV
jgi:hypothetical protein